MTNKYSIKENKNLIQITKINPYDGKNYFWALWEKETGNTQIRKNTGEIITHDVFNSIEEVIKHLEMLNSYIK